MRLLPGTVRHRVAINRFFVEIENRFYVVVFPSHVLGERNRRSNQYGQWLGAGIG